MEQERIQLQPHRMSWHPSKDMNCSTVQRYVVERYIPAPGYYFVFDEGDVVRHIPIDQDTASASAT